MSRDPYNADVERNSILHDIASNILARVEQASPAPPPKKHPLIGHDIQLVDHARSASVFRVLDVEWDAKLGRWALMVIDCETFESALVAVGHDPHVIKVLPVSLERKTPVL
jgi:hypothetical protein